LVAIEDVSLSITHATRRAFAVAGRGAGPLGLDLCEHADAVRVRRVARRAFPREDERARVLADDRRACIAWAAKEAVAKALRIGMLEGAGVERIEIVELALDADVPIRVHVDHADPGLAFEVRTVDEGVLVVARPRM
jgi:phosphopantetheinyl transferase (holo-ACP synthase)